MGLDWACSTHIRGATCCSENFKGMTRGEKGEKKEGVCVCVWNGLNWLRMRFVAVFVKKVINFTVPQNKEVFEKTASC
jgi:hypothetical protein